MTPEEQLNLIEATHALADVLTDLRNGLVEKGWTASGAEQAAIFCIGAMIGKA